MADPSTAQEYYNYLSGTWRNGIPMTVGGSGFGGDVQTKFAFHDEPNNENGWSMCTVNLPMDDKRTIQGSGPFRLNPGQVNELIIGIPWVPDVEYPCPDMSRLFAADDLAQELFDNCFADLGSVSITQVNNEKLNQIEVYPNPVQHSAKLVLKNGQRLEDVHHVDVYNAAGVLQLSIQNIDNSDLQLDLHNLNSGMHFYKVNTKDAKVYSGKFVKIAN